MNNISENFSPESYPKLAWGIEAALVPDDGHGFRLLNSIYETLDEAQDRRDQELEKNAEYDLEDIYKVVALTITKVGEQE